jgi:UDP-2-acetamido-3-amino-2,3-dideoxy-glucuronate N-acetyltransferase
VVCGHTIGRYAFVGAGAVVTRDVPDYALAVGNPARLTGWMCVCGVKLATGGCPPERIACGTCGAAYRGDGTALLPVAIEMG